MTDVLRVGILTPLQQQHSDPRAATDFVNAMVNWHVFQPPFGRSKDGRGTEPVLFDGHLKVESSSGDHRVWSAALKPGIRFSDGTTLTARHVARSLEGSARFAAEADVEVDGDRLFFRLKRPNQRFDWVLCHQNSAVVLEKRGRFIGTGPYVLVPGGGDSEIRLVANPHFGAPVPVKRVDLKVYPVDSEGRPSRLIRAVNKGEVDFSLALSRDDLRSIRGVHKWMGQGESVAFLYFNTQKPYLRSAEIRKALCRAVDRRELAARSYSSPLAFAATGLLPASLGTLPDGVRTDVEEAQRLLASAGGDQKRTPLRLMVVHTARPYLPHPMVTAQALAEQLAQLGLQVDIEPAKDIADFYRRTALGDYDLALSGWIPDTADLVTLFEVLMSSDAVPGRQESAFSCSNLARFSHAPMDQALSAFRSDPSTVNLRRIGEILNDQRPLFPLLYGSEIVVRSWRIKQRPKFFHNRPFFAELSL